MITIKITIIIIIIILIIIIKIHLLCPISNCSEHSIYNLICDETRYTRTYKYESYNIVKHTNRPNMRNDYNKNVISQVPYVKLNM